MPTSTRDPKWMTVPRARDEPAVRLYVASLDGAIQTMVVALRDAIKGADAGVEEGILWGVPFFFSKGEPFCYTSAARRHVTLGFTRGAEFLSARDGFSGTGKTAVLRRVFKRGDGIDAGQVGAWVRRALALPRDPC